MVNGRRRSVKSPSSVACNSHTPPLSVAIDGYAWDLSLTSILLPFFKILAKDCFFQGHEDPSRSFGTAATKAGLVDFRTVTGLAWSGHVLVISGLGRELT